MRVPTVATAIAGASVVSSQARSIISSRATSCVGGTWHDLASIPFLPRQEHAAVAINSTTLAVLGGISGSSETGVWNNSDLVTLYDVLSNKWTPAAPLPIALNHPNAATVDGRIYLLGGLAETFDQNGTWRAVPNSWVYDPKRDQWEPIASFPQGTERGSAAVGVSGTTIYLAGGLRYMETVAGGTIATVSDVSAYETTTDSWRSFQSNPLPQPRDHAGGAVVGNKFYTIGGRHISGRLLVSNSVYVLDLDNIDAGWETSDSKLPTARAGHGTAVLGSLIYTFGGEGNLLTASGVFNETEVFDPGSETWTRLKPMRHPRHGSAAISIGDGIIVPGGGVAWGSSPVDTTDIFRP
ncbi:kelch repeat-containing protein [Colletotrichum tofieldiae]|uniref:Kelch repeat-containing protein n=1 Tax=Colletotrichum tofieldiae TaxID=708197 RepID=A0A161WMX3_9PEZI|nr:kelch repeat-containing protein [Colletotrichum tofieldiae]GKT87353.1 kelch repeat-containing protein [Colletotrichum tofieldiae]